MDRQRQISQSPWMRSRDDNPRSLDYHPGRCPIPTRLSFLARTSPNQPRWQQNSTAVDGEGTLSMCSRSTTNTQCKPLSRSQSGLERGNVSSTTSPQKRLRRSLLRRSPLWTTCHISRWAKGPVVGPSGPSIGMTATPPQETPAEEPPMQEVPVTDPSHSDTPAPMETGGVGDGQTWAE